jgi:lipoprotein-releasing system permease protein
VKGKKVSQPIVRISIISITLAIVVNLLTIAVVTGFKREVSEKVTGFGSHIYMMNAGDNSIYESAPILKEQDFYPSLKKESGIKDIHYVAYKPVIFQSNKIGRIAKLKNGKDSIYEHQEIHGAMMKGIDSGYDLTFFQHHLKEGRLPKFIVDSISDEVLISRKIAQDLNLKLNGTVRAFFVKDEPVKRIFKIVGLYETGLEELDKKIALCDIRLIQELNDWGVKASIVIDDTLSNGNLIVRGEVQGGNGNYRYDWGDGFDTYTGFIFCPTKDTVFRLIASDFQKFPSEKNTNNSISDTAYLKIKVIGNNSAFCNFNLNDLGELDRKYLSDDGMKYQIMGNGKNVIIEMQFGKGSNHNYVGGFEVSVNNWSQLPEILDRLKKKYELIPTRNDESLKIHSILETQKDVFLWLGFLDVNVAIILFLMLLIGIINMGSALLVLILVKTNFIGILKAMGANNWEIRKIFLIQSTFLIIRGMIWGNVIGLGLCAIQHYFGIFSLNPEVYYLDKVPIDLDFSHWLLLNIGTLIVCVTALIVPSVVITRINPIKAIRFN